VLHGEDCAAEALRADATEAIAAVSGGGLRNVLDAPQTARLIATPRLLPETEHKQSKTNKSNARPGKGDISNEVRKGTF
jgi:hypothetical protein